MKNIISILVSHFFCLFFVASSNNAFAQGSNDALVPIIVYLFDDTNPCNNINIPDDNLKAVLRATAEIPDTGAITCDDIETLTSVIKNEFNTPANKKIVDITGLNHATNLTTIDLSNNAITTIEDGAFSSLANLTSLELFNNAITTIESDAFRGLTNLETLRLSYNALKTIESGLFSGLTNLETLSLGDNALTTIESGVFSGLTNLETLSLRSNALTTIESGVFSGLTNLERLELSSNAITTIEDGAFDDLTNLLNLSLSHNAITDITVLQDYSHRNTAFNQMFLNHNCLDVLKVPTKGILAGIDANTIEFYDGVNPITSDSSACPTPLPLQAKSVSHFDLDSSLYDATENWTIIGNNSTATSHSGTGGSPNGFIEGTDDLAGTYWYFKAPQQYYGNALDYAGGLLSFSLKSSGGTVAIPTDDVVLRRSFAQNISLAYRFNDPTPGTNWTRYNVRLSHEGWEKVTVNTSDPLDITREPATASDMSSFLTRLGSLEIRGDHINGFDTTGLDRVSIENIGASVIQLDTQPNSTEDFTFSVDCGTQCIELPFQLDDASDSTLVNSRTVSRKNGTYIYTQTPKANFITSVSCDDPNGGTTVNGNSATIIITNNEVVTCTFTNIENWSLTGNNSTMATYNSGGGHTGDFFQANDDLLNSYWYFKAPPSYYGNKTEFASGILSFYMKSNGGTPAIATEDVILTGGGITLNYRFDSPNHTPGTDWTYYAIRLSPEGWTKNTNTNDATQADMNAVLANLTSLEIRGDHINGADTTSLDTVLFQKAYTSSPNVNIPDSTPTGTGLSDTLNVPNFGVIKDLTVFLDISHGTISDLIITLEHDATGITIDLLNRPTIIPMGLSCDGNNIKNTLNDDANVLINSSCSSDPFGQSGTAAYKANTVYKPAGNLDSFDAIDMSGDWTLKVIDKASFRAGTLKSWSLFFR